MLKHLNQQFNLDRDHSSNDSKYHREQKGIYQKDSFDFLTLVRSWHLVVGEKLSKNTAPLKIIKDQLIILTSHAIYSNELNFLQLTLIKKIEENFPTLKNKIHKLNFQTANNFFKEPKPLSFEEQVQIDLKNNQKKQHQFSPHYQKKLLEAKNEFKDIKDEELNLLMQKLYLQLE